MSHLYQSSLISFSFPYAFRPSNIKVVRVKNEHSTKEQLQAALTSLSSLEGLGEPLKTLLFFYSGHLKQGTQEPFAAELKSFISKSIFLEKIVILFDCCYAPALVQKLADVKTKMGSCPVIFQINATKPSKEALLPALNTKISYFTRFFLQGLTLDFDKNQQCFEETVCDICKEVQNSTTKTDNLKIDELFLYIDKHMRRMSHKDGSNGIDWKPTLSLSCMDRDNANIAYRYGKKVDIKFFISCQNGDPFETRLSDEDCFKNIKEKLFQELLSKWLFM